MERTAHRATLVAVVIFRRPYCVHTTGVKFLPGHSLSSERFLDVFEETRNGTLIRRALDLDSEEADLLLARAVVDDAGQVALRAHLEHGRLFWTRGSSANRHWLHHRGK